MNNHSLAILLIAAFASLLPSVTQAQSMDYYVESPSSYAYDSTIYPGETLNVESIVQSPPMPNELQFQNPNISESVTYAAPTNPTAANNSSVLLSSLKVGNEQVPVYSEHVTAYSPRQYPVIQTQFESSICTTGG